MKPTYFLIQTLLILCFGLTSCSTDESSNSSNSAGKLSVEIQNSDETIQRIQKTRSLRATSNISLNLNDEILHLQNVTGTTTCHTNFLQGQFLQNFKKAEVTHVNVKDILPAEVFAPSQGSPQIVCDIELNMDRGGDRSVRVVLESVTIEGIQTLDNLPLNLSSQRNIPYFYANELSDRSFPWPAENGEIVTLCDQSKIQNTLRPEHPTSLELFPSFLFAEAALLHCRLHFRQQDTAWVSQDFWVQEQAPRLAKTMRLGLPGRRYIDLHDKPVIRWELQNKGRSALYFQWKNQPADLKIVPAFRKGDGPFKAFQSFRFAGEWLLAGANRVQTPSNNESIYRLSAGETVEIALRVRGALQCRMGTIGGFETSEPSNDPCLPHMTDLLHGYRFEISALPDVKINRFETFQEEAWVPQTLNPSDHYRVPGGFQFWIGNKDAKRWCSGGLKMTNPEVGEAFAAIPPAMQSWYSCEQY